MVRKRQENSRRNNSQPQIEAGSIPRVNFHINTPIPHKVSIEDIHCFTDMNFQVTFNCNPEEVTTVVCCYSINTDRNTVYLTKQILFVADDWVTWYRKQGGKFSTVVPDYTDFKIECWEACRKWDKVAEHIMATFLGKKDDRRRHEEDYDDEDDDEDDWDDEDDEDWDDEDE